MTRIVGLGLSNYLILTISLLSVAACGGGGDGSGSSPPPTPPSSVTLTALSPASATEGSAALQITATGSGFTTFSSLEWNGTVLMTSYVSTTSLTATIPPENLATAGVASVTVSNTSSGGASSAIVHFTVSTQTAPAITTLAPSAVAAGGASFQLIVNGNNFAPGATVMWNGRALTTSFDSATRLTAQVTAAQIATAASFDVSVVNDAAAGGTSNVAVFMVSAQTPVPTLTSISPSSIPANSAPLTLTFIGTGFTPRTVVFYGNATYQPTYVSASEITLANFSTGFPAGNNVLFSVQDPASDNVNSNALALSITPAVPIISAVAPAPVFAAQGSLSLTVTGQNFSPTSVVYVNGSSRPTTINNGVLTAQLTALDVANAGSAAITVEDPLSSNTPSNVVGLVIQSLPSLALTTLSPATVPAGNPAFTLTVFGNGFSTSSAIAWNGAMLATTHVSVTELRAPVSAAQVASTGGVPIKVVNPASQGGTSAALTLSIVSPSIDAVSFQMNNAHNGYVAFKSALVPTSASWSVNLGGAPSSALIVGNRVYVFASVNGNAHLFALDGATGATLWGPIAFSGDAGMTYDANTLFVNSGSFVSNGILTALDAGAGTQKWAVAIPGQFGEQWPAIAAEGIAYMLDVAVLTAFDESSGSQLWSQQQASGTSGSVAGTVDGIYVSAPCLTSDLQPVTGSVIWTITTGCEGGGGNIPAINGGAIYSPNGAGFFSGDVYGAETGSVLGSFSATAIPAVSPTTAYILDGTTLQATSLSNGQVNWSFMGDGNLVTAPVIVNNYVFVGSSSGLLYALDATSGTQLWSKNLGAPIPAPATPGVGQSMTGLAAGDGLLIVPAGNTVNAFVVSTNP